MKIIVDTSVWIEYLKNQPNIAARLDSGLLAGHIYLVGPIVAELLQGARTDHDFDALNNTLGGVPCIDTVFSDWHLAGEISYRLRRKGITVPITNCLIAALALNNDAAVYTFDHHFKQIPDLKLID